MNTIKKQGLTDHNVAYNYYKPFWIMVLDLKEPLPKTLGMYLDRFQQEDDDEYARRVTRVAQVNMVDIIVKSYLAMMFSTSIQITSDKYEEQVTAFVNRCNENGDDLITYMRENIAPTALAYGHSDIVVDMPEPADDVLSLERQRTLGIVPYCYTVNPLNRYSWKVNNRGEFTDYRSMDILDTQVQAALGFQNDNQEERQYIVWTTDAIQRYDGEGKEIGEAQPNPYGYIPIVTCIPIPFTRFQNKRLGDSLVKDVVHLQKRIINTMSLINDFHINSNFSTYFWRQDPEGGELPSEDELKELGNTRGVGGVGKDTDLKRVSPDAAGVDAMQRYLGCLIEWCYQSVSMPCDANINKTHQTGETIRSNQAVLFNELTSITKHFEKTVKQVVEMALRIQGLDPFAANVKVQWDTNFSYESFVNALEQATILKETVADMSPTLAAEFIKKVSAPQLYGAGAGIMDEIGKELDGWAERQQKQNEAPPVAAPSGDPQNPQQPTFQKLSTQINAADKITASENE